MSWNYTNNPSGSSRDALRLAVGDTTENDPRLSDEEVEHFLGLYPESLDLAAAKAAEAIAARYSSMAVSYVGDLDNSPHLKAEYYLKLARQLRSRASEKMATISANVQSFFVYMSASSKDFVGAPIFDFFVEFVKAWVTQTDAIHMRGHVPEASEGAAALGMFTSQENFGSMASNLRL